MAEGFWCDLVTSVVLAGLNVDEPRPLPPSPVELLPMVRSHRRIRIRVGPVQLPQSLVPPSVALETVRRPVSLRVGRYLGSRRGE